jgi:hypothetical protein
MIALIAVDVAGAFCGSITQGANKNPGEPGFFSKEKILLR